jgi:hypothetical protein
MKQTPRDVDTGGKLPMSKLRHRQSAKFLCLLRSRSNEQRPLPSSCLSVHMSQLGSHRTDFRVIQHWRVLINFNDKFKIYFKWRRMTFNSHKYLRTFITTLANRDTKRDVDSNQSCNSLKPNDHFMGRTVPLTSRRCILYIYSTNIRTDFKHAAHSPFCSLQNAVYFIMLPFLVPVLF